LSDFRDSARAFAPFCVIFLNLSENITISYGKELTLQGLDEAVVRN